MAKSVDINLVQEGCLRQSIDLISLSVEGKDGDVRVIREDVVPGEARERSNERRSII